MFIRVPLIYCLSIYIYSLVERLSNHIQEDDNQHIAEIILGMSVFVSTFPNVALLH